MTTVFHGVGVSPGVAVGKALRWHPAASPIPPRQPPAGATALDEIRRFAVRENERER